jgi:hypothetical protein
MNTHIDTASDLRDLIHCASNELPLSELPCPLDADVIPIDWQENEANAFATGLTPIP